MPSLTASPCSLKRALQLVKKRPPAQFLPALLHPHIRQRRKILHHAGETLVMRCDEEDVWVGVEGVQGADGRACLLDVRGHGGAVWGLGDGEERCALRVRVVRKYAACVVRGGGRLVRR